MTSRYYNVAAPSAAIKKIAARELYEAAQRGVSATYHGIPVRIVCTVDGWVTAISKKDIIYQGWAGEFTIHMGDFMEHYGLEAP